MLMIYTNNEKLKHYYSTSKIINYATNILLMQQSLVYKAFLILAEFCMFKRNEYTLIIT